MSNVPQHLIEELKRQGIVPGAVIRDTWGMKAIVPAFESSESWDIGDRSIGGIPRISFTYNYNYICVHSLADDKATWATVITPAPSKEEEGLKEGDAVECGPATRAAIIELAKELGICHGEDGGLSQGGDAAGVWNMHGTGLVNVISNFTDTTPITPEAFMAKMRVTAALPRPIKIDGHEVKYEAGHIKVGCQTIPNATVRAIAEKLID